MYSYNHPASIPAYLVVWAYVCAIAEGRKKAEHVSNRVRSVIKLNGKTLAIEKGCSWAPCCSKMQEYGRVGQENGVWAELWGLFWISHSMCSGAQMCIWVPVTAGTCSDLVVVVWLGLFVCFSHSRSSLWAPLQCALKSSWDGLGLGGEGGTRSPIPHRGLCLEKQHRATYDCFLRSPCKNGNIPQSSAENSPSRPLFLTQQDLTCSHISWGGGLTCWEEVWWLQKSQSMNQRYFNCVFCDLPMFSILLLSATSSSGAVQRSVLEKSVFLFSFNALLWTLLA